MRQEGRIGPTAYRAVGNGPNVVFVHGNGSTRETWDDVTHYLSSRFRCISYDLRGHGQSYLSSEALTLDLLRNDLEALRHHLDLDRFTLVGHSLGSFVAVAYSLEFPHHVERLCLLATPAARDESEREASDTLLAKLRSDGLKKTIPTLTNSWYTDAFIAAHPGTLQRRLEQVMSIDDAVFIDAYALYSHTSIDEWLEYLEIPTLVMTGEYARSSGAEVGRFIADRIPDSRLITFRGMKNGILTEIPHRVACEIAAFHQSGCVASE